MERESFEIKRMGNFEYITVLDKFYHHYTRETIRYIRIENILSITGAANVTYKAVDENEWKDILAKRVGGRK